LNWTRLEASLKTAERIIKKSIITNEQITHEFGE
jgi:hypothetical protein